MSNIKQFRIVADVPFNWMSEYDGMPKANPDGVQAIAALLLTPDSDVRFIWSAGDPAARPNSHGGVTTMRRLTITGREAVSTMYLTRVCRAIAECHPFAKLHIAEARDLEFSAREPWRHLVPREELSGEAQRVAR